MDVAAVVAEHGELQTLFIGDYKFTELFLVLCEESFIFGTVFLSTLFNLFLKVRL